MCIYHRVLKIPLTEKINNEEVWRMMGTGREIVRHVKTGKLQYLGHLTRMSRARDDTTSRGYALLDLSHYLSCFTTLI